MNRMNLKRKKSKRKRKFLFFLFIFTMTLYFSFKYLVTKEINIDNQDIVRYLLKDMEEDFNTKSNLQKKLDEFLEPYNLLNMNIKIDKTTPQASSNKKPTAQPLVYLYNTHQTEEYAKTTLAEYAVSPTVMITNYIMQNILEEHNVNCLIEERRVKDVLNLNGWNYSDSYKATRVFLEDSKKEHPTLKYYIDLHRDSLIKDKTTVQIGDKSYAQVLFLIGLENENHAQNLAFTEQLNNAINSKYENLSKGIYKKSGPGVNGIYNQDFSPYSILIEIGGYENTTTEVMNTVIAISEIIGEVIKTNEQKEYS